MKEANDRIALAPECAGDAPPLMIHAIVQWTGAATTIVALLDQLDDDRAALLEYVKGAGACLDFDELFKIGGPGSAAHYQTHPSGNAFFGAQPRFLHSCPTQTVCPSDRRRGSQTDLPGPCSSSCLNLLALITASFEKGKSMSIQNEVPVTTPATSHKAAAAAIIDEVRGLKDRIPHFVIPESTAVRQRLARAASLPPEFIDLASMATRNNEDLAGGGNSVPDDEDLRSYADAYGPLADELEAMALFVRHSVRAARIRPGATRS
ncbi:MAG TPA: hypothetical protein VGQ21_17055 [Thermoanaerobaculia bacterium]|jgi:hypothetical protein|nr:hypothetical protein [Thermoanaerobaculia bacterium]